MRKGDTMTQWEALFARQYNGNIVLKQDNSPNYLGHGFAATNDPQSWRLFPAEFDGVLQGKPSKTSGYWIFQTGAFQCWQFDLSGFHELLNWDVSSNGLPEDLEIFIFKIVDAMKGTVKIYTGVSGSFVGLIGSGYQCQATEQTATIFRVGFCGYQQGISIGVGDIIWAGN
jgi:hypothetical protein